MLDLACIFTTGGVLLFYKTFCELGLDSINDFIRQTILQDKIYDTMTKIGGRTYKWTFDTELGIVFLFIYQEVFQDMNMADFLGVTVKFYKKKYLPDIAKTEDLLLYVPEFEEDFGKLMKSYIKKTNKKSGKSSRRRRRETEATGDGEKAEDADDEADADEVDIDEFVEEPKLEERKNSTGSILKEKGSKNPSPKKVSFEEDEDEEEEGEGMVEKPKKKLSAKERMALLKNK